MKYKNILYYLAFVTLVINKASFNFCRYFTASTCNNKSTTPATTAECSSSLFEPSTCLRKLAIAHNNPVYIRVL